MPDIAFSALTVLVVRDVEVRRLLYGVVLRQVGGSSTHNACVPDAPKTRAVRMGIESHRPLEHGCDYRPKQYALTDGVPLLDCGKGMATPAARSVRQGCAVNAVPLTNRKDKSARAERKAHRSGWRDASRIPPVESAAEPVIGVRRLLKGHHVGRKGVRLGSLGDGHSCTCRGHWHFCEPF
jgi:hypothetical protein